MKTGMTLSDVMVDKYQRRLDELGIIGFVDDGFVYKPGYSFADRWKKWQKNATGKPIRFSRVKGDYEI